MVELLNRCCLLLKPVPAIRGTPTKAEVELFSLLWDKHRSITHIPGVTIRKNANGKITHVPIDVEQQKELAQPVPERLGVPYTKPNQINRAYPLRRK